MKYSNQEPEVQQEIESQKSFKSAVGEEEEAEQQQ